MGNLIRIVFDPTLYFVPINRNRNFKRLSELAHTAWREDGPSHFHCIWSNQISCWENICLVKCDWSSTGQAESIRTSLQRLEIGIISVSAHGECVCWETQWTCEEALIFCNMYQYLFYWTLFTVLTLFFLISYFNLNQWNCDAQNTAWEMIEFWVDKFGNTQWPYSGRITRDKKSELGCVMWHYTQSRCVM